MTTVLPGPGESVANPAMVDTTCVPLVAGGGATGEEDGPLYVPAFPTENPANNP